MIIEKTGGVGGAWVDKKELRSGDIVKLTSEAKWIDGQNGKQLVAKMRIKGIQEEKNVAINSPSKNALIEAFGDDSNNWKDKHLTVATESGIFAGKRGIALYLIPEGFSLGEDNGYVVIKKAGEVKETENVEYPEETVNLDDIPF